MPTPRRRRIVFALVPLLAGLLLGAAPSLAGLLGINDAYTLYDINTTTGAATNPRVVGNKVNSIAMSPSGTLYGVSQGFPSDVPAGGNLYSINVLNGFPTFIATLDTFIVTEGDIACDPITGFLYAVDGPGMLFRINTTTGACQVIGDIGTTLDLSAMTFDAAGNLWVVDSFGPTLHRVDKSNAAILATVPLDPVGQQVGGLAFSPGGTLFYTGDIPSKLYTLNTVNGNALTMGPTGHSGGTWGLAWAPDPTPAAPSTWGGIKAIPRQVRLRKP